MTGLSNREHKLAIVVPAYNAAPFIEECLNSIANQSYKNWQCFIIDDGSTDETRILAEMYAEQDSRFNVIRKENGGVSSARNFALELIERDQCFDWIGFVDSDDRIDIEMYSLMIESLTSNTDAGIAICGVYRFGDHVIQKPLSEANPSITSEEYVELIFSQGPWANSCLSGGYVCRSLFRKQVIAGLRFTSRKDMIEDELYSVSAACKTQKITIVNKALYGYRNSANSLTHTQQFWKKLMNGRKCCIEVASKISERARFVSVVAYLYVAINAFKRFPHPIYLLKDYEIDLRNARKFGLIDFKTFILYQLFTKFPILSDIYRKIRKY